METMNPADLIRGVSPVLEVPFDDDENIDAEGFGRLVDHVLGTGVSSVMFPGFASEFHKLGGDERITLRDVLLARTRDRPDVAAIISVPEHATVLAVAAAVDAVRAGADAINLLPPHLLGPAPDAVRAHIASVLDAVHPVPVVLQYAPAQTGTALTAATIAALRREHDNLHRVKVESTPPGRMVTDLLAGDLPIPSLIGYGGLQLPDALRRGAVGVQPGCSFTELYQRIWRDWEQGRADAAEHLHRRLLPYLSYWLQHVELIIAAEKLISRRRGLTATATCRRPRHVLDPYETAMIDRFLAEFADELAPTEPLVKPAGQKP
ncbi:dihydrodipicolinate synthase family protein [Pseudonocardia acaciae]|uniref:dihydrodipicolinate synthase family protein n=1 Tax=Pseudonocardia acaciae TaxID=551276 RepID=UPI00068448CC|nr:dihydrodipicolinate synthase family protein [Pseudonocardia acaciae]